MTGFGTRLLAALDQRLPLCVGIDPHPQLLEAWGLPQTPSGLRTFSEITVGALGDQVAALKPQSAFFERFGSAGIGVLEDVIAGARAVGALVVLDAKRGDIWSTAEAYAGAYLDPERALFCDALTVSPYLGFGSLSPFIERAGEVGSGLFVLARTSNPEGASVQAATGPEGLSTAQRIVDDAAAVNAAQLADGEQFGSIGVVVGATVPPGTVELGALRGPVLAPGIGAQGAGGDELHAVFGELPGVLPSSSREILAAGPDHDTLRAAARAAADALRR